MLEINFVRHRPPFFIKKTARHFVKNLLTELGLALSGAAATAALAGYGALVLNRDIPIALGLGATGSLSISINTKLKGSYE